MLRKLLIVLIIMAVLGGAALGYLLLRPDDSEAATQTTRVDRGDLVELALASGTVEPHVQVEVKSRASGDFGPPREQVGPAKRSRLSRVAELYTKQHRISDRSIRFDIVEVELDERGAPGAASVVVGAFGDQRARPRRGRG